MELLYGKWQRVRLSFSVCPQFSSAECNTRNACAKTFWVSLVSARETVTLNPRFKAPAATIFCKLVLERAKSTYKTKINFVPRKPIDNELTSTRFVLFVAARWENCVNDGDPGDRSCSC